MYYRTDMRIYLDVPYSRKDEAKSQGCKWDPHTKKWYVKLDPEIVQLFYGSPEDFLMDVVREANRRIPPNFNITKICWDGVDGCDQAIWDHLVSVITES
jgi:hypothetical protein